ncbi:MAG: O-antigen ligase family protein [Microgenomates group bacterium]
MIFLFILFLPTQLGKHFFLNFSYIEGVRVDYLAPTIYFIDIIFLLLLFQNFPTIVFDFWKVWWIFIVLMINIFTASSKPIAFYSSLKIFKLLAVFFIFKKIKISAKKVLLSLSIMGVVELFLTVGQIFYQRSLQGFFYFLGERYFTLATPGIAKASLNGIEFLRPYGTFSHPNSLAGFYLLVYFFVLTNKKFNQFFYLKYLSLFIFSSLVFISFSKVAIVSYLILNVIYSFMSFPPRLKAWRKLQQEPRFCKPCIIARTLTLLVVSFIFLQATTDPLTWAKRVELLKNALTIIFQHPVFGVGLGNYLLAQNQFVLKYSLFFNQPVHNIFLLFFAEVGVPFGLFIFYKIFVFFKKNLFAIYYLLFAILITGFFDHYWLTLPQNFLLVGVVFGLALKQNNLA